MKLTFKFTSLMLILVVLSQVLVYGTVKSFIEEVVADVLLKYGQAISEYDTERTLAPIIKEVELTQKLVTDPNILSWAKNPEDPQLHESAEIVLENFRWQYQSSNYFVALQKNLGYYFNNQRNEFEGQILRHHLNMENPSDSWFFDFISGERNIYININPNDHLEITRLWVDMMIKEGDEVLGVAGTGIDFNPIETTLFEHGIDGIDSLFIDSNLKVQLFREQGQIKSNQDELHQYQKLSLSDYIVDSEGYQSIENSLINAKQSNASQSSFVNYNDKRHLIVVNYIEPLDWFELTLVDMETILPTSQFQFLYVIFGGILIILVVAVSILIRRWITKPIKELETKTRLIANPDTNYEKTKFADKPSGEIGHLMTNFEKMAETIQKHTHELEKKVQQRTEALDRLANRDPLTELLNRRGMEAQIKHEISHARREKSTFGLIWLDVDYFKEINDTLGHDKGDEALKLIADTIALVTRDYDSACRWGGDEFLILLRSDHSVNLIDLAERLRIMIRKLEVSSNDGVVSKLLSVSIGCTEVSRDMSVKSALIQADAALYHAKDSGRNSVCLWTTALAEKHSD